MTAVCVENEPILLHSLCRAVDQSPDMDEVVAFEEEEEAIDWVRKHPCDMAFLDIHLHSMTGLEVARKMREDRPGLGIVFCTAYDQYALEALQMHLDCGFLLKPIQEEQVLAEIDHYKKKHQIQKKLLRVVCFGSFEAFHGNEPLRFRRNKTRELLAYLIDRCGAYASANEICAVLWEEGEEEGRNRDYLYHLLSDLRQALRDSGAESVLKSMNRSFAVDVSLIDCDYYRLKEGDLQALRSFHGEYMNRYSWAEGTAAWLIRKYG